MKKLCENVNGHGSVIICLIDQYSMKNCFDKNNGG